MKDSSVHCDSVSWARLGLLTALLLPAALFAGYRPSSMPTGLRVEMARKIYLQMLEKAKAERSQNAPGVYSNSRRKSISGSAQPTRALVSYEDTHESYLPIHIQPAPRRRQVSRITQTREAFRFGLRLSTTSSRLRSTLCVVH
jgi:hypothetical protein